LSINLFDDYTLFVDSSEMDEYREAYPDAKIVEHAGPKGLTPKRNTILKYGRDNGYDAIFQVDDDFKRFCHFSGNKLVEVLDKGDIYNVIERLTAMAIDANIPLYTFSQFCDIRKYQGQRNHPFGLCVTLKIGCWGVLLNNNLNFDERFIVKADIDFGLQVLLEYRKILIENRYAFDCKAVMGNRGGVASYRNKTLEKDTIDLLYKKWGEDIFSRTSSKRVQDYTVNVRSPFK